MSILTFTELKANLLAYLINATEIPADKLNELLQDTLDTIEFNIDDFSEFFKGLAETTTDPGTPTSSVMYQAAATGTYTNFDGLVVTKNLAFLVFNGSAWELTETDIDMSGYVKETMDADLDAANYPIKNLGAALDDTYALSGASADLRFLESGKNKANPDIFLENYYFKNTTGVLTPFTAWYCCNYLPVLPSTDYVAWNNHTDDLYSYLQYYDVDKNWLGNNTTVGGTQTAGVWVFTTPINCYYIGITAKIVPTQTFAEFQGSMMLELGTVKTSYEAYDTKLKDEFVNNSEAKEYADAADIFVVDFLTEALSNNINIEAGSASPLIKSGSLTNLTETFVLNTSGLLQTQYPYIKRWTGTSSPGNMYGVMTTDLLYAKDDTIFSNGFWIKDQDVIDIVPTGNKWELRLYDGGYLARPMYDMLALINGGVGTRQDGSNSYTNLASDWYAVCLAQQDGWSYIVQCVYNMVWNVAYTPVTPQIYWIFSNMDVELDGDTIDTIGNTFLRNEYITGAYVYPDANGKGQVPRNIEENYNSIVENRVDIAALEAVVLDKDYVIIIDSDIIYIRSRLNSTEDLVNWCEIHNGTNENELFEFIQDYRIPNTNANTAATILSGGTQLKTSSDDVCPNNYNGVYIGGGHGASVGLNVLFTLAHGKDVSDIGNVYSDGSNQWTILEIPDTTHLVLVSANQGTSTIWSYLTSISGTLTYVSGGGSNQTSIIVSSYAGGFQFRSCIKRVSDVKILIDSGVDIYGVDGVYETNYINIIDEHHIVNFESSVQYIRDNPGVSREYNLGDVQVYQYINYRWIKGSNLILHTWKTVQEIDIGYMGFTQFNSFPLTSGIDGFISVPNSLIINGNDFRNWVAWDSTVATTNSLTSAYWRDVLRPPHRISLLAMNTGNLPTVVDQQNYTFNFGYLPGVGINGGVSGDLKDLVDRPIYLYSSGKCYPGGIDAKLGNIAADSIFFAALYRNFTDLTECENSNNIFSHYVKNNESVYVFIDAKVLTVLGHIIVPEEFEGMTISEIDSYNMSLLSDMVSNNRINLSSLGVGFLELKLT